MYSSRPSQTQFPGSTRTLKLMRPARTVVNNVATRTMIVIGSYSGVFIQKTSSINDGGPVSINSSAATFFGAPFLSALPGDQCLVLESGERFRVVRVDNIPSATILILDQSDVT